MHVLSTRKIVVVVVVVWEILDADMDIFHNFSRFREQQAFRRVARTIFLVAKTFTHLNEHHYLYFVCKNASNYRKLCLSIIVYVDKSASKFILICLKYSFGGVFLDVVDRNAKKLIN